MRMDSKLTLCWILLIGSWEDQAFKVRVSSHRCSHLKCPRRTATRVNFLKPSTLEQKLITKPSHNCNLKLRNELIVSVYISSFLFSDLGILFALLDLLGYLCIMGKIQTLLFCRVPEQLTVKLKCVLFQNLVFTVVVHSFT